LKHILPIVAGLSLLGCPAAPPKPAPDAGGLPDRCVATAEPWVPGQKIYTEVTTPAGLEGVKGMRLNVVDVDGDGYADVWVRNYDGPDEFGPDGARKRWLLRNNGDGTFADITESSGLLTTRGGGNGRPGNVSAAADVDNDGDQDLLIGHAVNNPAESGDDTTELMLNNGDGTFALGPADHPLRKAGRIAAPAGFSFADVDRDGDLDLWATQAAPSGGTGMQDELWAGDGQGGFNDVTAAVGLSTRNWSSASPAQFNAAEAHTHSWGATVCDVNGDGTPDLLSPSYGRMPNRLWLGEDHPQRGLTYANQSIASGYAFDANQDWTDNESARCWCQLHRGDPGCSGVPAPSIRCQVDGDAFRWTHSRDRNAYRLGGNSGSTVCFDVNNDGHLDLLTSEIKHWDVGTNSDAAELLLNDGQDPPQFDRPGNVATRLERPSRGRSWDEGIITNAVFDFDNDGWPDVFFGATDYTGNRALLYQQYRPGEFDLVPIADGVDHLRSHGVVSFDFDRDGDLDLLLGHSRSRCSANQGGTDCYPTRQIRLFKNNLGQRSNWLQLDLEGSGRTNRDAVGARVTVTAGGVTQTQEVSAGHGHYGSQVDHVLHFGLGAACTAEVTVRWPDQALSTRQLTLAAGYRFHLVQGGEPTAQ
jgi:enediyne biosynthesis protein E4